MSAINTVNDLIFNITHFPVFNNYSLFGKASSQARIEQVRQQTEKMLITQKVISITNTRKNQFGENKPREDRGYADTVKINNKSFNSTIFSTKFISKVQNQIQSHHDGLTACFALITRSPDGNTAITVTSLGDSGLVLLAESEHTCTVRLTVAVIPLISTCPHAVILERRTVF